MDSSSRSTWAEIAAGAGLGMLVGLLVGLSATSVIGGVITALTAVMVAFLGLNKAGTATDGLLLPRARIASFGIVGSIAVVFGLAARAHDWLGSKVGDDVKQWTSVGATPAEAIDLVAWQRLGVTPRGRQVASAPPKSSTNESVLFSATTDQCALLLGDRFNQDQPWLDAMSKAGPGWKGMAQAISAAPADRQHALLDAAYKLVCGS